MLSKEIVGTERPSAEDNQKPVELESLTNVEAIEPMNPSQVEQKLKRKSEQKKKKPLASVELKKNGKEKEDDIDKLLDQFAEAARKCSYGSCKQSISLLGQRCQFCSAIFCLK